MGGLMSIVETSINSNINDIISHSNSVVMNDIHELNKDYYEGYQWIACLDSATCLACAELDNQIFDKLPGMPGQGTEPPTEPPLHKNCRCIIVPVLEGMKNDPRQTQINYKDWFNGQNDATKLDILGPSRYREYLKGKEITSFAKDGHITTLKEMGIDRIIRKGLFDKKEIAKTKKDGKIDWSKINTPKEISAKLQKIMGSHVDLSKIPDIEIQQKIAERFEILIKKYPGLRGTIDVIDVNKRVSKAVAHVRYYLKTGKIELQFCRPFGNQAGMGTLAELNNEYQKWVKKLYHPKGTTAINVIDHEFAHVIDRRLTEVLRKEGKLKPHENYSDWLQKQIQNKVRQAGQVWDRKNNVSLYAEKNTAEFMADSFSMSHGTEPSQYATWARELIETDLKLLDWM
jgi:hypothetical protein